MKSFRFAQFYGVLSLAGLLLMGCESLPVATNGPFEKLDAMATEHGDGLHGYCYSSSSRVCEVTYEVSETGRTCSYVGRGSSLDEAAKKILGAMPVGGPNAK